MVAGIESVGPESLNRGLLSDQIYSMLRAAIKDSTYRPGEQIVESQLARQLQVSQAPVRDALRRLVHEGLVVHLPHQGNFVSSFSVEDAAQAKVVRIAMERLAGELACGQVDDAAHATLTAIVDGMDERAKSGDVAGFRDLDFAFHRAVVEIGGNAYLLKIWDLIEPAMRSMFVLSDPRFDGDWRKVATSHRQLLTALRRRKKEAAAELFARHAQGKSMYPLASGG